MKISIFLIEVLAATSLVQNKERVLSREEEVGDAPELDSEAVLNKNLFLNLATEELARNSLTANAEKSIKPSGSVKSLKSDDRNDDRR